MCLAPDIPQDNSAAVARQQAEEREAKIRQGKTSIDEAFSGFNDDYFKNYQDTYLGYYNPQIDDQFSDAKKNLRYNFARAGTLDSTAAQGKFGDLIEGYTDRRREAASNALDAANALRTSVEQNKSDLYSLNSASADPSLSSISALSRAGSLQSAPSYSPIGDLFSGLTNAGVSYLAGSNKALPFGYADLFGSSKKKSSGGVVN